MKRESAFLMVFLIILVTSLSSALEVQSVEASGTTYVKIIIKTDGSIDPPAAPIFTVDKMTYTLTDNINFNASFPTYEGIRIDRDSVILDGAGHTIQGSGALDGRGVDLWGDSGGAFEITGEMMNMTIKNLQIKEFYVGIWCHYSNNNTIFRNNITDCEVCGIDMENAYNNTILENNIIDNTLGVGVYYCSNNMFYHNNFVNTLKGKNVAATFNDSFPNYWDAGFPSGGNYWSDYERMNPNASEIDDSGMWNTSYYITSYYDKDNYPLMTPYIIPESPSFLILPLFFIVTLLTVIIYGGKRAQRE